MYDVMIIDDDNAIREHLKDIIDWEGLGLRLVCEAGDSDTARELYQLHTPKIVVTDINIPTISGLELAREFLKTDPEIRFIVITGYNDFEYVRDSVALGAVELLSKPLFQADINGSLAKAVAGFDELRKRQTSSRLLQQLVSENLPMLRERYAAYLLQPHPELSLQIVEEKLRMLHIDISGSNYAVALMAQELQSSGSDRTEMALMATKNEADKHLASAGFSRFSFLDDSYRLNCIVGWDFPDGDELLEQTVNRISERMSFLFHLNLSAGIGQPTTSLLELSVSAAQAMSALNLRNTLEFGDVVSYKNIARLASPAPIYRDPLLLELGNHFKANRLDSLRSAIDRHFVEQTVRGVDLARLREFSLEYVSTIFSLSFSLGLSVESIPDYPEALSRLFSCRTAEMLREHLLSTTETLLRLLFQKRSDSKNRLIADAKDFINANLSNDKLSLEMVSSEIGLSSIYFCKLFHKEAGVTFNEYLNSQRIRLAKKMLAETNKKVFEVCYDAGYSDPKYFNRIFKRTVGITPLEYKKSL